MTAGPSSQQTRETGYNMAQVNSGREIPALNAYLTRIGADELNFRRYMVREWHGKYYVEKGLIRIVDGKIKVSHAEYAPTDDERERIERALKDIEFPHSIGARDATELVPLLRPGTQRYEIY